MRKIKVLLVFCNWSSPSTPAIGITSIATHLIEKGFVARIFDEAPYLVNRMEECTDPRESNLSAIRTDKSELYQLPYKNRVSDFFELIADYTPHIVAVSTSRYGFLNGIEYLEKVKELYPETITVVGGAFSISEPGIVISYDCIDMVATGEGEVPLEMLCNKLSKGEDDLHTVEGFWTKDAGGKLYKNPSSSLIDINEIPPLRFDLFDKKRFYRPFGGRIRRVLPIEISRGCPHKCSNCSVPLFADKHKKIGRWYRIKTVEKIEEEICAYIEQYQPEYFFMMSCTFFAYPKEHKNKFIEMYKKYKIPFYMATRPEQINEDDMRSLVDVGLDRMSVGVECGNEAYRKKMLGRGYSNKRLKKVFNILGELDIPVTTNVMIGLPDETREMIYETIRLVKEIKTNKTNVTISIYQAYEGTPLYQYCIEKGYYDKDYISDTNVYSPNIRNSNLTGKEVLKFLHSFILYVLADESDWPEIDSLDITTAAGQEKLRKLREKYSHPTLPEPETSGKFTESAFPVPFSHV